MLRYRTYRFHFMSRDGHVTSSSDANCAGDRPGPQYRPPRYPGALPFALLVTAHLPDYLRL